jgi:prepilin peptidase CpaA
MKKKLLATGKPTKAGEKRKQETIQEKQKRRIMAYAMPIAIATWGLLIASYTLQKPLLPWLM